MFSRINYSLFIIALLLVIGCNGQPTPVVAASGNTVVASPRNDIAGLSNFAWASQSVCRGAQPDAQGFKELKKIGIKTIINLRSMHSDNDMMKGLGLQYCAIPSVAHHSEEEDVIAFLKVATNPAHQPVFVHCQHGSDRTGLMLAIYRIYVQNWSKEDALKELEVFGRHDIYSNIPKFIKAFDVEKMKAKLAAASEPKVEVIE